MDENELQPIESTFDPADVMEAAKAETELLDGFRRTDCMVLYRGTCGVNGRGQNAILFNSGLSRKETIVRRYSGENGLPPTHSDTTYRVQAQEMVALGCTACTVVSYVNCWWVVLGERDF
jgi:hypothetical protein